MTDDIISSRAGYWVASASHPGYFLLVDGASCSCPAGDAVSCRHRRLVAERIRQENLRAKRPVAPPHTSALVD